ncbi:Aste57867_12752 [Aphanomyces stellatus]|uniref:Aste57867_12752 protein n=1 Tax=Aphanomyces stellatus TaxID=120398 RepID=A0A485KX22_9STRA|nr:hypothetical protein As57867_012704 [Aphanomyces stellatus]VFT89601.1 Aste57867_12752 [Aphanomyces stellatus]
MMSTMYQSQSFHADSTRPPTHVSMKQMLLQKLAYHITTLSSDGLDGLLQLVSFFEPHWFLLQSQADDGEIDLDLQMLQPRTLHAIEQYVAATMMAST